MSSVQFTALIRLPFIRGDFEDPPQRLNLIIVQLQAQWDGEKDRQLWKVVSKTSKTSELDYKFQVPPTFLLQQAAWLYERHLDHVRNQMKRVSISNAAPSPSPTGGSTLTAVGGVAMRRGGSAGSGAGRAPSALAGRSRDSPVLRGAEITMPAPSLSRTPSTTTITQSRALAQAPTRNLSTRSNQRPTLTSRNSGDTSRTPVIPSFNYRHDETVSPEIAESSSSSSSSLSDTDHPAHRSQLFKRPPRFQPKRMRDLATFEEGDGTQEIDDLGSHETSLPFASAARAQPSNSKYAQDTQFRAASKSEQKVFQKGTRDIQPSRQTSMDVHSLATTETASSMTSSSGPPSAAKSPMSPVSNHRAELGRLGSPRHMGLRGRKEGSEGTPSMGSSFSDIDDAGISQSALEEALLSNMRNGRMISTAMSSLPSLHSAPPPILISDYTTSPPLTTSYTHGANAMTLCTAYPLIKSLLTHPPCTHRRTPETWPCAPCESTFTSLYWTCAATLLDYFSDFFPGDTSTMQAIWFDLLDIWQESAATLPYERVLKSANEMSGIAVWGTEQARRFEQDVRGTIDLFQIVIWGEKKGEHKQIDGTGCKSPAMGSEMADRVLFDPRGEAWCSLGEYETGPWKSGVKPWLQFLGVGGPGVAARTMGRDIKIDNEGAGNGSGNRNGKGNEQEYEEDEQPTTITRYVPQPAIAIIKTHTARLLDAASHLDTQISEDCTVYRTSVMEHSLTFPEFWAREHTYESKLTGCKTTYSLRNDAPPIMRYRGFGDPTLSATTPDWNLLDECVAISKNKMAYEPVGRPEPEEGVAEESDEESDEEEEVFDMWTVTEHIKPLGDEKTESNAENEGDDSLDFGPMFDNWVGLDEFDED
ncbi:multidomain presynaptic cytomatrix related [Pyrenophora seminiperda CCB06]|uniref:Autophagy-related protein 29 n=1 Tax=Pyrenophora seminiperda CCB06 TaxID=1302712 RepID=A0A3M7MEI7_9PLEO|nr:multidomain presynaptic cytomatrix related [Pyrenophora seminiperda CCB06]